ncbi:MAG: nitrilase-related carbon-nitrogen hydrolase, partial [Lachnospiraceae bacterium]
MKHGFLRVAAATPHVKVADPGYNREQICREIENGKSRHGKIMVFPELALTAYTCNDLFLQDGLLLKARGELKQIIHTTKGSDMLVFVGMPWERDGKLYNVAAVIQNGRLLGLVPKTSIPNYSEFYEARYFEKGNTRPVYVEWEGNPVPMGTNLLFRCKNLPGLVVAAEICEDVWVPCPPSISHALAGATVIVNCSASDETTGKDVYRKQLITGQSARLVCGYVYANAGEGESTQDLVFGGHNL